MKGQAMAEPDRDFVSARALITDLFEIIDGRRWDELGRVLAEDCVAHPARSEPLVGLARIEHYYRHERPIESGRHRLDAVVSDVGAAACWGTFTGRTAAGEDISVSLAEAFLVRDGKIVWRTTYVHPGPIVELGEPAVAAVMAAGPE